MAIRVLKLDDDNHAPSYHAEDTTCWHDADHFIAWLTRPHTVIIPYEVRKVELLNAEVDNWKIDVDLMFSIVDRKGKGYSFEEYQEAFNILWDISEAI